MGKRGQKFQKTVQTTKPFFCSLSDNLFMFWTFRSGGSTVL